jgi:hypothetical protein
MAIKRPATMLGILGTFGAAIVAGIGSGAGERIVNLYAPESQTTIIDRDNSTDNSKVRADDGKPLVADVKADSSELIVRFRTSFSLETTGKGASEEAACKDVSDQLTGRAESQCDGIVTENMGMSGDVEMKGLECRSCRPVAGNWRCIGIAKPICTVKGVG